MLQTFEGWVGGGGEGRAAQVHALHHTNVCKIILTLEQYLWSIWMYHLYTW